MRKMSTDVNHYFTSGCGRCDLYDTPQCKVQTWSKELKALRTILLECGLNEESKWGVPCYTFENKNILILSALKEYACIGFFKGALLHDENKMLTAPGENSQATRQIRFTDVKKVATLKNEIKALIFEAIEIEKAGLKIKFKKPEEYDMPQELKRKMKENLSFKKAFQALTPGRQKGYLLHFSQAKQSFTRESRIEKCIPAIMKGKGLQDR